MRDLKADLELCEKATQGPWEASANNHKVPLSIIDAEVGQFVIRPINFEGKLFLEVADVDVDFITTAREGWPEAIKRAIVAEQMVQKLETVADIAGELIADFETELIKYPNMIKLAKALSDLDREELFISLSKLRNT